MNIKPGYENIFKKGKLTFGFIMPLESYPDSAFPSMENHSNLAIKADQCGFSALWLRDIPFYDPSFGDVGQIFDPMVYLGYLVAQTKKITLGTAGIILPLKEPLVIAKQAASLDHLSQGRFILGLSTGDRPIEYPAFGQDFELRAERFREAIQIIKTVTSISYPQLSTHHYGRLSGDLDLVPKPIASQIPLIIVGRAQQDLSWIADNSDGWIWHRGSFEHLQNTIKVWRESFNESIFKPYGYGTFFDLDKDPDAPVRMMWSGFSAGRNSLIRLWKEQESLGVNHVALNLKMLSRPATEVMDELAEYVLPHFSI
ncbi:LLM class oxidoreductase [Tolumonas osonensis]|uniref:Luciferase-type oxidoreductase n=1 Tax=Tolumonas osonensis TaxID=675874 RepID=A0A841GAX6_9GAMM|nr:LLM class oxidoreductase [Tolumonas osonensis]MBB6056218.1 luciferase-type oxidoreductase [Tolumonas osonensis]